MPGQQPAAWLLSLAGVTTASLQAGCNHSPEMQLFATEPRYIAALPPQRPGSSLLTGCCLLMALPLPAYKRPAIAALSCSWYATDLRNVASLLPQCPGSSLLPGCCLLLALPLPACKRAEITALSCSCLPLSCATLPLCRRSARAAACSLAAVSG